MPELSEWEGQEQLLAALEEGRREDALALAEAAHNGDYIGDEGDVTGLIVAAAKGYADVVNVLLQGGANPDTATEYYEVQMKEPCQLEEEDAITYITPLMAAALRGHQQIFERLAPLTDPEERERAEFMLAWNTDQTSPAARELFRVVRRGPLKRVRELLAQGVDVNSRDAAGFPPLYYAARSSQAPIVEELLKAGADPSITAPHRLRPVEIASHPQVLLLLGAGPESRDRYQRALLIAVGEQRASTIRQLLQMGVDINVQDENGDTPLGVAIALQFPKMVRLLLELGADPNGRFRDGTALGYASEGMRAQLDVMEMLLQAGADPNARAVDGRTPMMSAVVGGIPDAPRREQVIHRLLAAGANPTLRSQDGRTAADIARYWGRHESIPWLGAGMNAEALTDDSEPGGSS